MVERDFKRLCALLHPVLDGAPFTDEVAAEVRHLLKGPPTTDQFPSALPHSVSIAREEWPAKESGRADRTRL